MDGLGGIEWWKNRRTKHLESFGKQGWKKNVKLLLPTKDASQMLED